MRNFYDISIKERRLAHEAENTNASFIQNIPVSLTPPTNTQVLAYNSTSGKYEPASVAGGTGTVTSVSVASANGFAGTVANATTTPAITLTTSVTGILKGNGTTIAAASDGSDYLSSTTGVKLDQTVGQTIGDTTNRLTKLWATDITVTNAIAGSVTGNAATATKLLNARTIGGVSFDGTGNITVASATGGFTVSGGTLTNSGVISTTGAEDSQFQLSLGGQAWHLNMISAGGFYVFDATNSKSPFVISPNTTHSLTIGTSNIAIVGDLAMAANNITMTGSLAATGARVTKGWFTDVESTNMPTVGGTAILSSLTAPTFTTITATGASSLTLGTASSADGAIILKNATNAFTTTIQSGVSAASRVYTLPTDFGAAGSVLTDAAGNGTLSWAAAGGSFSWGASASPGAGTGFTLTSTTLDGSNAHISSAHTASGTLTADTTNLNTFSSSRTHTAASSVTDNFAVVSLSRTNVSNNAGATLLSQGSVLSISGTDTQTSGALTPSYNLLKLSPSARSIGSTVNVVMPNSLAGSTALSIVVGNTQTNGNVITGLSIDTGTAANYAQSAIIVSGSQGYNSNYYQNGLVQINQKSSATQNANGSFDAPSVALSINGLYNTNSAGYVAGIQLSNEQNAGSGYNTGLIVYNKSTELTINDTTFANGAGIHLIQDGAGGTMVNLTTVDNVNSSTNGLVNYTLSNTQSGATVVQKIDTGTSSQGHTLYLANMVNGSTSAKAFSATLSTTGTGIGYSLTSSILAGGEQFANWAHTASGTITANSTDKVTIASSRTHTGTTTVSETFNVATVSRTSIANNASANLTEAGTVLKLTNTTTNTSSTAFVDTVDILNLTQSATITTGKLLTGVVGSTERFKAHPLVANSGSNNAYLFDTTTSLSGSTTLAIFANAGTTEMSLSNGGTLTLNGNISINGGIGTFGSNSATSGNIRLPTGAFAEWRNAANNANLSVIGTDGSDNLYIGDTNTPSIVIGNIPRFNGTNSTGAGSALLGANSPASTLTTPYTWISAKSSDGSTVYFPCWK